MYIELQLPLGLGSDMLSFQVVDTVHRQLNAYLMFSLFQHFHIQNYLWKNKNIFMD